MKKAFLRTDFVNKFDLRQQKFGIDKNDIPDLARVSYY